MMNLTPCSNDVMRIFCQAVMENERVRTSPKREDGAGRTTLNAEQRKSFIEAKVHILLREHRLSTVNRGKIYISLITYSKCTLALCYNFIHAVSKAQIEIF